MATCENCGTWILFGPIRAGGRTYCSQRCAQNDAWIASTKLLPAAEVEREVRSVHQGNCPRCQGPGPVDVHTSHSVYSALVFTRWASHPVLACRSCGRKQQLKHAVSSTLLGWWGFPFGLLITPVQVIRNLGGLMGMSGPSSDTPSPALEHAVRISLVGRRSAQPPGGPSVPGTT